ncbi:hypothetical protein [Acidithiobacillus ferriphilus]|uniref:hypothetical protein n=1 Tax=Acidithiobacillus ferriphilus TaxID=1689834 RepID=UPI001C0673D9|nr:hypothetical protein [Acidithiobacillus ferriphilus]MBU2853439.1 hypothetical protein [Acidithiobacillus ferriphilus]
MKKQDMLNIAKKAFPVKITQGEALLDAAIFTISQRFIRCMDPGYVLPDSDSLPDDPWFAVIMAVTEMLLGGRQGKLHFTHNSFPFLRG